MPLPLLGVHLAGCAWLLGAPVPVHPGLEPSFEQVLRKQPPDLDPFLVPDEQVVSSMRELWSMTRESAEALARAGKPSEVAAAWGALVPTCANCHRGDPAALPDLADHGGAFRALLEGVRVDDPKLRRQAVQALYSAPDLGPGRDRILQVAEEIAKAPDQGTQALWLKKLPAQCWRCHAHSGEPIEPIEPSER